MGTDKAIDRPKHGDVSTTHTGNRRLVPSPGRERSSSTVIIPKYIYIRDGKNRILTLASSLPFGIDLKFRCGDPSPECIFESVQTSPSWFKFIASNGSHIMRGLVGSGETYVYYTHSTPPTNPSFNVIISKGNTVFLKDDLAPFGFMSTNYELGVDAVPIALQYVDRFSELTITQASAKSEITDIVYDIDAATILEVAPIIALSTTVRNDSVAVANQTLTYSYEKSTVGTWNNRAGIEVRATATFSAGIPFLSSVEFEISVGASHSHEWGGTEGVRETITTSTEINVPPRTMARATILVQNAQIDVPFTYTETIIWSTGETTDVKKNGIYRNVDSWHVDVQLTDMKKI